MKRFVKTVLCAATSLTMAFMCVPVSAFAAAGEQQSSTKALSTTQSYQGTVMDGAAYGEDMLLEYHYKDSYFVNDSTTYGYDASLSTLSFSMALAAFGTSTGHTDADYANADSNIKAFFNKLNFTDYECTEDFHKVPTEYSIGAAIAHKEIKDENGDERSLIAIAIRGGSYQEEWGGNAIIGKSGEAEGFGIARDKVVKLLNNYLEENKGSITTNPKIWIAGFSRASAVTNLTANFLNRAMEIIDGASAGNSNTQLMKNTVSQLKSLKPQHKDLFAYGYEVPAGGSNSSIYKCNNTYKNIWNIVDPTDLVPLVAPKKWGFIRYGTDIDPTSGVTTAAIEQQLASMGGSCLSDWQNLKVNQDGEFRLYNAGLIEMLKFAGNQDPNYFTDYDAYSKSYKATYLNALINFTADKINGRSNYVDKYEKVFSLLTKLYFGLGNEKFSKFMSVFTDGLKGEVNNAWTYIKIALNEIAPVGKTLRQNLEDTLQDGIEEGINALKKDETTKAMLSDADFQTLYNAERPLAVLITDFLYEDNHMGQGFWGLTDGTLLPTAIHYGAEIISGHNVHNVMAYLRAKDPNFQNVTDGCYYLTLSSSENGGAASDVEVSIIDGTGRTIATYEDGQLYNTFSNKYAVTVSTSNNGSTVFRIPQYTSASGSGNTQTAKVKIEATSAVTKKIYIDYYNFGKDLKTAKDSRSSHNELFEQRSIPFTEGDTFEMSLDANNDETTAFSKKVTKSFQLVKYDENVTGHYADLNDDTQAFVSVNGVRARSTVSRVIEAYGSTSGATVTNMSIVRGSGESKPYRVFTPKLDSKGLPIADQDGAIEASISYSSNTWTQRCNLYTTSDTFWAVCIPYKTESHTVTVSKTLDGTLWSGGDDLIQISTSQQQSGELNTLEGIAAGELVTVEIYGMHKDKQFLAAWRNTENLDNLTSASTVATETLTFAMPERDVDLVASFLTCDFENPILTVTGGWDTEVATAYNSSTTVPKSYGWIEVESQEGALLSSSTVSYRATNTETGRYFFLKASAYKRSADGTLLKFDHWKATDAFGTAYTSPICMGETLYYNEDGSISYVRLGGDSHSINGCTDTRICISGKMFDSAVMVAPVYTTVEHNYSITLSDGRTVTGTAAAGSTVEVGNSSVAEGYEFDEWAATYKPETYTADKDGYMTKSVGSETTFVVGKDSDSDKISFTMPEGDVTASAVNEGIARTFTLNALFADGQSVGMNVDGVAVSGNSLTVTKRVGDRVTINLESMPAGYTISGGTATRTVEVVQNKEDGVVTSAEFTMPNFDFGYSFTSARLSYTLNFDSATAVYVDGTSSQALASGDAAAYQKQIKFTAADAPSGKHLDGWSVEASDETAVCDYEIQDDGTLLLTMPSSAVTVSPNYVADDTGTADEIETIELPTSRLMVGDVLGSTMDFSAEGLASKPEVAWSCDGKAVSDPDNTEAVAGNVYTAKVTLRADSSHCFGDSLNVTVGKYSADAVIVSNKTARITLLYVAQEDEGAYNLVVVNGTGSGKYTEGESVTITADTAETGTSFAGFTADPSPSIILPATGTSSFTAAMPGNNLCVTANYAIDKVDLTIEEPTAGHELASTVSVSGCSKIAEKKTITFLDESGSVVDASSVAKEGECYTVFVCLSCTNVAGYSFSDKCAATINGNAASIASFDDEMFVFYTFGCSSDTGHTWGDWATTKEPTCTEKGEETQTCTICGMSRTRSIDATGHTWGDWSVTKQPTCTKAGFKARTCEVCEESEILSIAATGHTITNWTVDKNPTCTEEGTRTGTCDVCGETETHALASLGHSWSEWTITSRPTCIKEGSMTRACDRCSLMETRTLDKTDHSWSAWRVTAEPTCTEAGEEMRTCSSCRQPETRTIDALGHNWSAWIITKEATCTQEGVETRTCSGCDKVETSSIAMIDHTWSDWTVAKEATCTQEGVETRTCSGCDKTETRSIDALGHDWSSWTTVTKATYNKTGLQKRTCKRSGCGKYETHTLARLEVTVGTEVTVKYGSKAKILFTVSQLANAKGKGGEVTLTKALKTWKKAVTLKSRVKINGISYAVTAIAPKAFSKCRLSKLTIPASIKKIGAQAFRNCKRLKTLVIKSRKLTAKYVKKSLLKSSVKTIRVKVGKASLNRRYVKKYTAIFAKGISKKAVVVR